MTAVAHEDIVVIDGKTGGADRGDVLTAVGDGPVAVGVAVDGWNRKWLMVLADTGRAMTAASLPVAIWTGHLSMAQIYVVTILDGILATFFTVAQTAALPNVLSKEQLPAAMAEKQLAGTTSALLGPHTNKGILG